MDITKLFCSFYLLSGATVTDAVSSVPSVYSEQAWSHQVKPIKTSNHFCTSMFASCGQILTLHFMSVCVFALLL